MEEGRGGKPAHAHSRSIPACFAAVLHDLPSTSSLLHVSIWRCHFYSILSCKLSDHSFSFLAPSQALIGGRGIVRMEFGSLRRYGIKKIYIRTLPSDTIGR